MNYRYLYIVLVAIATSCNSNDGSLFTNPPAEKTGITFVNDISETNDLNILDYLYFYNGGGMAIGDINNDNLPDIFFSGNQVKNKLFLNKGDLQFEDITAKAGVAGNSTWNTGAVMGDVNGDGLLDIYVCAVVGIRGFNGYNELFINNGDQTFTESAAQYKLDFDTYSSSAAFIDYDLDGDLDLYILNHAIHTQESFGRADLRFKRNYQTGDKLMRNDGGVFTEVSEEAGIFGGPNGYGLGVAVADFNMDGYPDIYVGNDFHEDDYYYINKGDGTFTESLKQYFGHTTRFSMGNDVADINHDGWPDILSLDMLPEDEKALKSSEGDDNIQMLKLRTQRLGYHYQFTRNMLHINQAGQNYAETALFSGIAATDWSWSALFADYDQDGEQDLFVANGIPKRPNDLDYINFVSDEQIKKKINNTKLVDQQALDLMPSGAVHNYIFKGTNTLKFEDRSGQWISQDTLISTTTAMGDLDNDGDMDLITNNINTPPTLYINKTNGSSNYLKLKFKYPSPNTLGIGTKVFSYHKGKLQYKELYTARGFQASSQPIIHFGYADIPTVDSLKIIWPNGTYQLLTDISVNQTLTVQPTKAKLFDYASLRPNPKKLFSKVKNNLGIDFVHREDAYVDFNRQKLIPYQVSDRGPAIALGDLNNDGKQDIYFGGSKYAPSKVYVQTDTIYLDQRFKNIVKDSIKEEVAAVIADFNNDSKNDLFVGSGGADFYDQMKPLLDSYYVQRDSVFETAALPDYFENASVIKEHDFDNDGDLDLFVGSNATSNDFGKIPNSFLLRNDNGKFSILENKQLQNAGMITDAVWDDFDGDGSTDLIVVGEWMSPKFFKNDSGTLKEVSAIDKNLQGLWQCIIPFDIDNDGKTDYLLGNWGLNTKYKASDTSPLKMYYADFDQNGSTETVVAVKKKGGYFTLSGYNDLVGQMENIRKKFPNTRDFAGKTVEAIFDKKALKNADLLEVNVLESGYLKNENGRFVFIPFSEKLQLSSITSFLEYDFDGNGKTEVLAAGNYFGTKPFHGRFDSFSGALIKNENDVILGHEMGLDLSQKSVRSLNIITLKNTPYLLVTINNDMAEVYELVK